MTLKYMLAVPNSWPAGPFTFHELCQMRDRGRIGDADKVCEVNSDDWRQVGQLIDPVNFRPTPRTLPTTTANGQPTIHLAWFYGGGGIATLFLTLAQFVALASCVAIIIGAYSQWEQLSEAEKALGPLAPNRDERTVKVAAAISTSRMTLRIAAGLCFCLCAALVVVFSRVRTIVEAAEAQDAENQRLWHAIHELRTRQQGAT